jgi:hypothetical protein
MSETTNMDPREMPEPTQEEIKQMRANMQAYYKEQLPLVKIQAEYEKYLADIEEARARRISMNLRIAQMMTPPTEPEEGQEPEKKERKLKVQE